MTIRGVAKLLRLRKAGYLIGPPAEDTDRDWSEDESAAIKAAYRDGDIALRHEIREAFPGEADEVDDEIEGEL